MLFNSVAFLFFFLIVHQIFWRLPRKGRKYWLILASVFFYGYWDWRFLVHFLAAISLNYFFVRLLLIHRSRPLFALAITLNLVNLCFFKYTTSLLTILGEQLGFAPALAVRESLGLVLPLAISFYSFQIIAFTVDVWRGEIKEITFSRYAVFIMFFPQLIAGPIMRHHHFLDQIDNAELRQEDLPAGLYLLIEGLIKKVLLADAIAAIINPVWANPADYDSVANLAAAIGFSAQVYCDFSGYTDMARGMARLLGYNIPENFYSPYLSTSFSELWTRWHVTLSTWLRDYLYIPLGGSRVSISRQYLNIMVVMCLGGLWHGNTYTYFIWGFLHGVFLLVEKRLGKEQSARTLATAIPRNILVMVAWISAAVFFRAPDLKTAGLIFEHLFASTGAPLEQASFVFQLSLITLLLQFGQKYRSRFETFLKVHWRSVLPVSALIIYFLLIRIERPVEKFIYFQF